MHKTLTIFIIILFTFVQATGQMTFRVMSYNVENFFDTYDDPLTDDDDFLPTGNRHWSNGRYHHKLQQIAKVINAVGEWETPALIGLCEVENDTVLTHLLKRTPLTNQQYNYCMTAGSDNRGINVALLYQRDKFRYINHCCVPVKHKSPNARLTRDILHVYGTLITNDTLDVIVCHFPSKYGGEKESEARRIDAALTLKKLQDSLIAKRTKPHIIIMGDFNDLPESKSLQLITNENFYNLFKVNHSKKLPGSQKYQSEWSQLDQIIIHRSMLSSSSKIQFIPESAKTLSFPFLLTKDKTWRGMRPFRTYHGYKYEGGFSDHLPVIADFLLYLPKKE